MYEGHTQMISVKLRLLRIMLLQIWSVCGMHKDRLPRILEMPQDFIFASERYEPISFHAVLSPFDVHLLLLTRLSFASNYGFNILYNSSDIFGASSSSNEPLVVTVFLDSRRDLNRLYVNVTLSNWIRIISQPIHIQVVSSSGSIISDQMKIELYHLEKFNEKGDEYVEFVMGNVGQIVCDVPLSKPSPPIIKFQHHSVVINVTDSSRYMFVEFPPLYKRVALLIRNIVMEDSGIYRCISYLENTKLFYASEKKTHLIVKVPKHNIPMRFRLSSHSTLDDSNKIDVRIPEGSELVLYCVYESAPILEVNWYWPKNDRQYSINPHFGTLTISNVSIRDNSEVSCIINEGNGKIFRINVYQLSKLSITPSLLEISDQTFNSTVAMQCQGNLRALQEQMIHWFFNGKVVNNMSNILVKDSVLVLQRLTWTNIGLYQCVAEFDNKWLSASAVVQLSQEKTLKIPSRSRKVIEIKSGVSVNLRCQIAADFDIRDTRVLWYKRRVKKPLSMSDEKYLMYVDVGLNQHILSIRQSEHGQENGTYICRIYANQTGDILVETSFKLVSNKVINSNQSPNSDNGVIKSTPLFQITKPIISLPEHFLLAVNVTWNLSTDLPIIKHSNIISHYRIEVRQGLPEYRPVRWRSSQPMLVWNSSILVDKFYSHSSCIIHNSNILRPQYWYSFRALGIPDPKYFQLQFSVKSKLMINDFYHQIRSPWSDPINFEHILVQKPKITNVTVINSTRVRVKWIFPAISEGGVYQSKQSIEFKILYFIVPKSSMKESSKDEIDPIVDILFESQRRVDTENTENVGVVTKVSSSLSQVHQTELRNLKINSYYMIILYGILRPIYGGAKRYSSLSDVSFLETPWKSSRRGDVIKGIDQSYHNQTGSTSSYFRNKILFLILGSLAGILFVIALSMFIMCLWYQIMYHNRKRQNVSSSSSVKTSSANTFAPVGALNHSSNNSVFVTSSNIVSPQNLSLWYKNSHDPTEFSHLYLAQHFSLWSPNHLAQFNLPNNLRDQIIDETKSKVASDSPATLSTPSPKSNIEIEINNLDGSIEDSQEESVRLLDYQTHSGSFRREEQCTLNNAFSVQSEGRERKDQDSMSDYARSISHYPFSPSALDIYSQKKRPKFCSSTRKDFSSMKINLTPKIDSPTPCSPIVSSFCKDNSANHYNRLKKDDTFAKHPFPTPDDLLTKNCLTNLREVSYKQSANYSSMKAPKSQKLSSKFLFDPILDLNQPDDSHSNSTAASARHFSFSMFPDGVRPSINLELDQNNQTNL